MPPYGVRKYKSVVSSHGLSTEKYVSYPIVPIDAPNSSLAIARTK